MIGSCLRKIFRIIEVKLVANLAQFGATGGAATSIYDENTASTLLPHANLTLVLSMTHRLQL